jgi:general secretion pathway protein D
MRAYLSILFVLVLPAALAAEPEKTPKDEATAPRAQNLLDTMEKSPPAAGLESVTDRKQRAAAHYAVGKRLYETRLYTEARQELDLAVRLDPANQEAKDLLQLSEAILAVRGARIKSAVEQLDIKERVERQEQLNELENHVDRAKVLYSGATASKDLSRGDALSDQLKKLEEADAQLARAREIVKWMDARVPVRKYELDMEQLQDQIFKERKKREVALAEIGRRTAADEADKQRAREQEFLRRQVRMLMDKAEMLFARRDYEEAARLARRVMDLDPTNTDAVELETACRWKAIGKRAERTADLKGEAVRDWVELSQAAMVPYSPVLVYPKDWAEISRRESEQEKRLQEPDWKRNIRAALDKEVTLEFVEQPLEECIKYLQGLTDVNIIPDPAAFAAGAASAKQPITLRLSRTKLSLALKWILRMAKLDYTLKQGAIFISTPDKLTGELQQKIYDVRDLTNTITNFPGPILGLPAGQMGAAGGAAGGGAGGVGAVVTPTVDVPITPPGSLQDMIKRVIQPASWGVGGTAITETNGQIVVFHQPEVQAQISQLIEDFRKSQTLQVHVEARYLDVKQGLLEEIGVDWGGTPGDVGWSPVGNFDGFHPSLPGGAAGFSKSRGENPTDTLLASWGRHTGALSGSSLGGRMVTPGGMGEGLSVLWSYMGDKFQVEALLRAVKKEERSSVLFAPRLTMFNNQRAHILVGQQTTYVAGWTSSGTVSTPNIQTAILDGVSLDVRPIVSHDRRYITLELRPTLVRPIGAGLSPTTTTTGNVGNNIPVLPAWGYVPGQVFPPGFILPDGTVLTIGGQVDPTGAFIIQGVGNGTRNFSLPQLEIRTIRTVVTVPDGGTVLLSGLMTEAQKNERMGIPLLMDLPVLGRLFSNDYKELERRNLLILVTAKLVLFSEEEQKL